MRTAMKIAAVIGAAGLLVILLYLGTLAYPQPAFDHALEFERYTLHSDSTIDPEYGLVLEEVARRERMTDTWRPHAHYDIYLCRSPSLYRFYASLSRVPDHTAGFCLSVFDNVFIQERRLNEIRANNAGYIRHSTVAGDLAEAITHEIMHCHQMAELGWSACRSMPFWKREGYPEYAANIAAIKADSLYSFRDRLEKLLNDLYWGTPEYNTARSYYRAQLMVEYLFDHEGFGFGDLMREDVTEGDVWRRLMAWYEQRNAEAAPANP
jgi:hypothetical protein